MENSLLNVAHEKQRRADALLQQGKFEEAADCHDKVAELLTEAHTQLGKNLTYARNSELENNKLKSRVESIHSIAALESLALQQEHHKKQAAVVRMKQAQYEEYKNTLETQRQNFMGKQTKQQDKGSTPSIVPEKFEGSLRQAIFRTIQEQDSLLSLMSLPDDDQAFKHPKDTGTVIEELRTVNSQLRSLVESLLSQLEAKEQQVRHLTQRLQTLSIDGNVDNCPDEGHPLRLAPLPPLEPLEMPLFDFNSS